MRNQVALCNIGLSLLDPGPAAVKRARIASPPHPIGQYLQPTIKHAAVERFVAPEEFAEYATLARSKGFLAVASSPLTRISYHADADFEALRRARQDKMGAEGEALFRSALDALQSVEDLRDMGVSLFLLDLGGDVTGTGISKLFLTIMSAVAEAERDRIRERITTVKRDQKAQHRFLGGLVPFGFIKLGDGTLIADQAVQEHIATAKRLRGEGKSLRTIRDVLASNGCRVSVDALHRTLRTPEAHG